MAQTHLPDLLEVEMYTVSRHFSSRPRAVNWTTYVKPEDALASMDPSYPLSSIARASFTGVNVGKYMNQVQVMYFFRQVSEWLQSADDSLESLILAIR